MPIDWLFEIVVGMGVELAASVAADKAASAWRDHRFSTFVKELPAPQQGAVLELLAAAALDDGVLSDDEKALLGKRAEDTSDESIQQAVSVAAAALPFTSDAAAKAYLSPRASLLASNEDRERVLSICIEVLSKAGGVAAPHKVQVMADAFGVSRERLREICANLSFTLR